MTNLSDLFPAGAGKQVSFTASGNVTSSGKPVVLNSDGTVSEVSGSAGVVGNATDILQSVQNVPDASEITGTAKTYVGLDNYNGGAGKKGTGYILTAASNAITVGAAADFSTNDVYYPVNTYDSVKSKIVQCWQELGGTRYLKVRPAEVSGTTITWGTTNNVTSTASSVLWYYANIAFDPDTGNFCIVYCDGTNSFYLTAWCGTCQSGSNTITMGSSKVVLNSASNDYTGITYDPDQDRFVVFYTQGGTNSYARVLACTGVDGTATISGIGSAAELGSGTMSDEFVPTYDTTGNKIIIVFRDTSNVALKVAAGTVDASGNTISFGTITTLINNDVAGEGPTSSSLAAAYDPNVNKTIAAYRQSGSPYYSYYFPVTLSGTDLTGGTKTSLTTYNNQYKSFAYNTNQQEIIAVLGKASTDYYVAASVVPESSNLTSTNFLGISDAAISSAASGNITIKGGIAATGLSSLTPATDYYVQVDGTITTSTDGVKAGKALSATAINLEYTS